MGKRNKNTKLVAKILSLAMITTMMSGYVAPPKEVRQTHLTHHILMK